MADGAGNTWPWAEDCKRPAQGCLGRGAFEPSVGPRRDKGRLQCESTTWAVLQPQVKRGERGISFSFSTGPGVPHTALSSPKHAPTVPGLAVLWLRRQRRVLFIVHKVSDCVSGFLCEYSPECDDSCLHKAASMIYSESRNSVQQPTLSACGEST